MRAQGNIKKLLSLRNTQPRFFKGISFHLFFIMIIFMFSVAVVGYSLKASGISPNYSGNWFVVAITSFILVSIQFLYTLPTWWRDFKKEWYSANSLNLEEDYQENKRTK